MQWRSRRRRYDDFGRGCVGGTGGGSGNDRGTVGQKNMILRHSIIHFPRSLGVSEASNAEQANE